MNSAYSGENRVSGLEAFFAHVPADVVKPLAGKMPPASDCHPGIRRFPIARVCTTPTQVQKKPPTRLRCLPHANLYEKHSLPVHYTCAVLHLAM